MSSSTSILRRQKHSVFSAEEKINSREIFSKDKFLKINSHENTK